MIMRSPIVAMLWEQWRLTRVEAAQRLALGMVAGSAALLLFDNGATVAFWILFALNAFFYMSIAKLNGGKFVDGYKPGFPLYLLYTRPVPTAALVGAAVAYDAVTCAASYLVTAISLEFAFGEPFPLLTAILLIVTLHLTYIAFQWSTRSRVVQWTGSTLIGLPAFFLLKDRATSPHQMEFSPVEIAVMVLICLVSFGVTVAGVARQRRGEAVAAVPRPAGAGGYPNWLVNLFRFPCPTSSPTRAQVWFELRSSGLPMLAIGLGLAMLIFMLFAIGIAVSPARNAALGVTILSMFFVLFAFGGNAFGFRRKQGRTYLSAFEASQPYEVAQQVGLKMLVRTTCVLVAIITVAASIWASTSLIGSWGTWVVEGGKDAVPDMLKTRQKLADAISGMIGYSLIAQAVIASVAVAVMVAFLATFAAVRARYPRPLLITGSLLLFHGFALMLLALAEQKGIASTFLVKSIFAATGWILVLAIVFATLYLLWSGFAARTLTFRYASVAVLISAAFAAAWLAVLHAAGLRLGEMSTAGAVGVMWPVLLPLMMGVAAPWSLGRVRHT